MTDKAREHDREMNPDRSDKEAGRPVQLDPESEHEKSDRHAEHERKDDEHQARPTNRKEKK